MNKVKLRKIAIISTISIVLIIGGVFVTYRYNKVQAYNNLITTANKYMDESDYDKAETLLEQSLQYKNDSNIQKKIQLAKRLKEVNVVYNNGTKMMNDKKYSEAIELFKKISKDDGELFSNAQKNIEECRKQYIAQSMELANTAFKNNKYDEANKYLGEVVKIDSNNSEASNLKNSIATAQKKKEEDKSNNFMDTEEAIKAGLLASFEDGDATRKPGNLYIKPVKLEPYKAHDDSGTEYNYSIAKLDSNSNNIFLITNNKYNENAVFDENMPDFNDTLIAWSDYSKDEKCYLIEYQSYYHILFGGNGDRFRRKIYNDGTIEGNNIWNDPYRKMKQ